ncbi:50S ribosomal protein L30 [Haloglycomyces albus]|uniref:50S ribosomal protein L30 n=1 Tax=Haloglycomyces albus TaxID=526067 RepID=UPI00046CDA1D|nr:50S ribosomal protein L30 [Haloglycomyces albus]
MSELKITQTRSLINKTPKQRATIQSLGLRRIRHSVLRPDTPDTRGMIAIVDHMVDVEEVEK